MFRKTIIVLLCLFMVAGSVIPQKNKVVYALNSSMYEDNLPEVETAKKYKTTTDKNFDISNINIESEEVSKRTSDSKTFRRVDGTYVLALYDGPIHYYDNGEWKDIDNSLSYNDSTDEYENQSNNFVIKFPKEISENKKIKLSMGDY